MFANLGFVWHPRKMDVRNTWKYPMFKQTHIMQGSLYVPLYPIIYLCIPSMIGFIPPCLSHGITHLSDKAISWKGLQQNPIKSDVFFIKYLPQNSCLHMFTLWNPSKCWCFGTSFSPWKTAMARGCTLFSIDQSGPTIHPGGDRSLWNCHMTRGESSSIHQPKKMGTKVLTMWGSPVTRWF